MGLERLEPHAMTSVQDLYWYMHACPLRKVDADLFGDLPTRLDQVRSFGHKLFIGVMSGSLTSDQAKLALVERFRKISDKQKHPARVSDRYIRQRVALTQSILWACHSWRVYRNVSPKDIVAKSLKLSHKSLIEGNVDIVRVKKIGHVNHLNMTWIFYYEDYPNERMLKRMFTWAQIHGRLYELVSNDAPTQLDIFFPLLNHTFSFPYVRNSRYEVIAELIKRGVRYPVPGPACNHCRECPMVWNPKGEPGQI